MKETMLGICKEKQEPGANYRTDLPVPKIGPNDVLVHVKATAICGTDHHIMQWSEWAASRLKLPMVFGHEFAGDIVEVGSAVNEYKIGDRIAGETHIPCNNCYQCQTDNRHICENMAIIGVHTAGSFGEYICVPKDCVYQLPDSISYEIGSMLEPMGVGVHGVSVAEVKGQNTLIYGCGPIGLMAVGAAKALGAAKIIAVDIFDQKLEIAEKMGAELTINSKQSNVLNSVLDATNGVGADVVIDYTGNTKAILDGFRAVRKGGKMVLVGLPDQDLTLNLTDNIIYKEATVIGVTGRLMYQTWKQCEEILTTPGFSLAPTIGGVFPLKDYEKAFEAINQGNPGKMILIP